MTGSFCDILYTAQWGFVVVVSAPNVVTAYRLDTGAVLWATATPSRLVLYVRACQWPDGQVYAVGQSGQLGGGGTDTGVLVSAAGVTTLAPLNYGQNCALITVEQGQGVTYFQTSGSAYQRQVNGQPAQTFPCVPTSQGWLDFDPSRGGLVWTDPNRIVTEYGVTLVCAMQRSGWWVGQSPTAKPVEAIGVNPTTQPYGFGVIAGGPLPHIATDGAGNFAVAAIQPGGTVGTWQSPFPPLVQPIEPFPRLTHNTLCGSVFPSL